MGRSPPRPAAEDGPLPLPTAAALRRAGVSAATEVAPWCAPPGRSLVSTSVLGTGTAEGAVRAQLAELYGCDTSDWQPLAEYRIPYALPAMPAPHPLTRSSRHAPGRYVCGDHRTTGSVQGALASGARAARELLADLAGGRAGADGRVRGRR
ncbi:FAD-dependent oxidoreductase [Kitasatospora sp. NPDC088134]|uniref:FAD-dependent oxidoreductase n=1 Tax=Kitasatospora sp. NPDC088134 TaxID=3364071 RepID=UPI0038219067